MPHWALDLGTTNTGLARWDEVEARPELVVLPEICRDPQGTDPLTAPGVIPSATHVIHSDDAWTRLGRLPLLSRRVLWGRHGYIGRQALERNISRIHPAFASSVKPHLQHQALRPVARLDRRTYSARDVARIYLRELLAEVKRTTGERIRSLTVTTPVDAYEGYRAELRQLLLSLGIEVEGFEGESGCALNASGSKRPPPSRPG